QLARGGRAAALAHHLPERVLQPEVLHFQGGEDEVFLAVEMLVKGRLADADVGQHLLQADVAEAVAVKPSRRRFGESPPRCGGHWAVPRRVKGSALKVDFQSPPGVPQVNFPEYGSARLIQRRDRGACARAVTGAADSILPVGDPHAALELLCLRCV